MARPNIPTQIDLPSIDTPMPGFSGQACGERYDLTYEITQPYKGVSSYSYMLKEITGTWIPRDLDDLSEADLADLTKLFQLAYDAVAKAESMIDGGDPDLPVRLVMSSTGNVQGVTNVVDAKNRQAIEHLIDKASVLLGHATSLWMYWENEWSPKLLDIPNLTGIPLEVGLSQVRGWPLDQRYYDGQMMCSSPIVKGAEVDGKVELFQFDCPTKAELDLHRADVRLYQELVVAALTWARCAQEAAAVVGVYHRNRLKAESETPKFPLGTLGGSGGLSMAPQGGGTPSSPTFPKITVFKRDDSPPISEPPPLSGGIDPDPGLPPAPGGGQPPTTGAGSSNGGNGGSSLTKVVMVAAGGYLLYRLFVR